MVNFSIVLYLMNVMRVCKSEPKSSPRLKLERRLLQTSRVMRKPDFCLGENKGAGQCEADQRLCFRCMDSSIPLLSKSKISTLQPSSVAAQAGLCQTWSKTPKTGFLASRLINSPGYRSCMCTSYLNDTDNFNFSSIGYNRNNHDYIFGVRYFDVQLRFKINIPLQCRKIN